MNNERKIGTVSAWKKTYGFIKVDGSNSNDKELFVYHEHIKMDGFRILHEGDRVSFLIGENHMGAMAVDVTFGEGDSEESLDKESL